MMIKFIDLLVQHKQIEYELNTVIQQVIEDSAFVYGKYLTDFENNFAEKIWAKNCIGVANGTDALIIVLKCLGIKQGDEVITAANSFIASAEAISNIGAKPVFVDHDKYYGINVDLIEKKINKNTKAIIPVHLYGQSCDIEKVQEICKKYGLYMIEDTAQSHFAKYKNKYTGTYGNAGCFSFYPSKNLGAMGDGGAIVTNDDKLAEKIRIYANHGSVSKYQHITEGINSRLDGMQAAILNVKLKYVDKWNRQRNLAGLFYNSLLSDCEFVESPDIRKYSEHFFHIYAIKCKKRDELQMFLKSNGIQTGIHYPIALPYLQCYDYLQHKSEDFSQSFKNQSKLLSLPMYPDITQEQILHIVKLIKEFYAKY